MKGPAGHWEHGNRRVPDHRNAAPRLDVRVSCVRHVIQQRGGARRDFPNAPLRRTAVHGCLCHVQFLNAVTADRPRHKEYHLVSAPCSVVVAD